MLPLNKIPKLKLMEIIARVDFFKPFALDEREILLQRSKCYKCVKGHHIQSELDDNSHFYVMLSGEAEILKQGEQEALGVIKAGEFIGEGSFIKKRRKSAAAKALTDSIVLCMDQDTLNGLPNAIKNKFKDSIIEGMAKRIMYLSDEIQHLKHPQ
jgi:CRP-like cAMP-binding protein